MGFIASEVSGCAWLVIVAVGVAIGIPVLLFTSVTTKESKHSGKEEFYQQQAEEIQAIQNQYLKEYEAYSELCSDIDDQAQRQQIQIEAQTSHYLKTIKNTLDRNEGYVNDSFTNDKSSKDKDFRSIEALKVNDELLMQYENNLRIRKNLPLTPIPN